MLFFSSFFSTWGKPTPSRERPTSMLGTWMFPSRRRLTWKIASKWHQGEWICDIWPTRPKVWYNHHEPFLFENEFLEFFGWRMPAQRIKKCGGGWFGSDDFFLSMFELMLKKSKWHAGILQFSGFLKTGTEGLHGSQACCCSWQSELSRRKSDVWWSSRSALLSPNEGYFGWKVYHGVWESHGKPAQKQWDFHSQVRQKSRSKLTLVICVGRVCRQIGKASLICGSFPPLPLFFWMVQKLQVLWRLAPSGPSKDLGPAEDLSDATGRP